MAALYLCHNVIKAPLIIRANTYVYATDLENQTTSTVWIGQVYLYYTLKDENVSIMAGCGHAL